LRSTYYERQQKKVENEEHEPSLCEQLSPPCGDGIFSWVKYIVLFPLVATLALTIPDVRKKSVNGKLCYLAFFLAIGWIGIYSYFMVGWAEILGRTFGIPSYIMGLTFLAAGTSVPDLISSVIVARMGEETWLYPVLLEVTFSTFWWDFQCHGSLILLGLMTKIELQLEQMESGFQS